MSLSPTYGGDGGSPYAMECDIGQHVTQVYGRSGDRTDQVCVKCSNGVTKCAGGGGGSPWYGPECRYVTNFRVQSGSSVDGIYETRCEDNTPGGLHGGGGGSLYNFSCPASTVLTGLLGRGGSEVDQVQFKCQNTCPQNLDWPMCQTYCSQNPDACGDSIKNWCISSGSVLDMCKPYTCTTADGSNLNKAECKSYCVSNPGKCDTGAQAYCKVNPSNTDFCGCYNYDKSNPKNDETVAQMLTLPQCYIGTCAGGATAYKTTNYASSPCNVQLTICEANLGQTAGGAVRHEKCNGHPNLRQQTRWRRWNYYYCY